MYLNVILHNACFTTDLLQYLVISFSEITQLGLILLFMQPDIIPRHLFILEAFYSFAFCQNWIEKQGI